MARHSTKYFETGGFFSGIIGVTLVLTMRVETYRKELSEFKK